MSDETQQVLDFFCGAGGFTLGVQRAGANVIAGVDNDEQALETYNANFEHPAYNYDLAETEPATFSVETVIYREDVDGIVGGPPCQSFSTANHQRSTDDPRANLVFRYATYVDYFQPDWFVMENVTGIESIDDGETIELLYDDFQQAGYEVDHATLNAADYGVPQKRRRVFFVGTHEDADSDPQFPEPTHAPDGSEAAVGNDSSADGTDDPVSEIESPSVDTSGQAGATADD